MNAWEIAQSHQGLIKSYLNSNRWIVDKSHTLEWEDYWQIGLLSLYQAAKSHKPKIKNFSTYAYVALKYAMLRAFQTQAFPVLRVPRRKHPKKGVPLEDMSYQESFTFNLLNVRVDLSATDYMKIPTKAPEEESMFVFFE